MKKILSAHDTRLFEIATYILSNPGITLRQLQKHFKNSLNTLYKDISYLNKILAPVSIKVQDDKKLYFKIPSNYSEKHIYSSFLSESREIECLELIFFNKNLKLEELSEKLYISLSTAKRIIKNINQALKEKNIEITSNPLRFLGKEIEIRSLFVSLFTEKYSYGTLPFSIDKINTIDKLYKYIAPKLNQDINYPELQNVRIWLSVSFFRTKQGYLPDLIPEDPFIHYLFTIFSNNEQIKLSIEKNFGLSLTEQNTYSIFRIFNRNDFNVKYELTEKEYTRNNLLSEYKRLLKKIKKSFSLELSDENEQNIVITMLNTKNLVTFETHILYQRETYFYKNFEKQFPTFAEFVLLELKKLHPNPKIKLIAYIELYILVSHWVDLIPQLQRLRPPKKIILFLDTDIEHLYMLKSLFLSRYSSPMDIQVSNALTISELNKSISNVDFVISNIQGDIIRHPDHIYINIFPTQIDWDKLDSKLE